MLISFRYLTDWGSNNAGWYIDNVEIPEIGFKSDGSSLDQFKSMNQILKNYVEYTVTFINEKQKGSKTDYKVVSIKPFNITEEKRVELRKLFDDGENYMITSYAAPIGDRNPVPFSYEIITKKPHKEHKETKGRK